MFSKSVKGLSRPVVGSPTCARDTSCVIVRSACNGQLRARRGPSCLKSFAEVLGRAFSGKKGIIVPSFTINEARRLLCFVHRVGRGRLLGRCRGFRMCLSDPLTVRTAGVFAGGVERYFSRSTLTLIGTKVGPLVFSKLGATAADSSSGVVGFVRGPGIVVSTSKVYSTNHVHRRLGRGL